jgi:hypothetical protein
MSKIFRRPMFRKGGNVGEGIMTGIVDREQYRRGTDPFIGETDQYSFNTPYQGRTIPSLKDLTAENTEVLLEAAGDRGGYDPLTSFLLAYGPAAAVEDRGGGTISNLIAATETPVQALIKEKADEAKFQRGIKTQAAGSAIAQRNEMIAAEADRTFKSDLAAAQERLQRDLTTQEIEAIRLRAEQKVKTDIDLAIKKSELDTEKGIKLLKEQETLSKASPQEKVEAYGAEYAEKYYGGDISKGTRRAEYEYIIGPKLEEKFGVENKGGFVDIDITNMEKTNKQMNKKIKAGGLNKYFYNIRDGRTYLLTEQGLQPINLDDPAAESVQTIDTTGGGSDVETEEQKRERLQKSYGFYLPDVVEDIQEKNKDIPVGGTGA